MIEASGKGEIDYRIDKVGPYTSRKNRPKFAYSEYRRYFGDSVLDVGGFRGWLGEIFPGRYENIDMQSGADHVINLDEIEKLNFDNKSFDTVVCLDVLEHLENIHLIFDEICRISKKSVIISMPNGWRNAWYILGNKHFSKNRPRRLADTHWTLPTGKPLDRHRWFYSLSEADELIRYRGDKMGFEVCEHNPYIRPIGSSFSPRSIIMRVHQMSWSPEDFVNLYAWVGWWVLCRKG